MKVRLNERQYQLLVEAESTHYGVDKLFRFANDSEFIILNKDADISAGSTVDLNSSPSKYKIVRKDDSKLKMSLQQTNSDQTFVVDFTNFDKGVLKSKETFKINNVLLYKGGKPKIIIKPKNLSPNHMNNKSKGDEVKILKTFVESMLGYSGTKLVLSGDIDYEFKSLGYNNKFIKLTPISSEIKSDGTIIIPINSITHNGDNTFTMKYESEGKSYTLKDIKSAKVTKVKTSGEFEELKLRIKSANDGDTLKIGTLTFIVNKTGNPMMLEIADDSTQKIFSTIYKSNLNEEKNDDEDDEFFFISLWDKDINEESGQAVFSFEFWNDKIKDGEDNKQTLPDVRVDLDSISVSDGGGADGSKSSKSKKSKKPGDEEEFTSAEEKEILKMILKDKRFRRVIKKGVIPAEEIVKRIMDKGSDKLHKGDVPKWMKSFRHQQRISFIPNDMVELEHSSMNPSNLKGTLLFNKGEKYHVVVGHIDKNKKTVELKGKEKKLPYKVILKKDNGNSFDAIISTQRDSGRDGKDSKKINIKIIK